MRALERLLLVDDDDDFVLLLKTAFEFAGFQGGIAVVESVTEAAEFLTRARPQLLLTDLQLHGNSGFDLLSWIRGRPELRPASIKVLTGTEIEGDEQRAYELGADEYLVKPLEFSRLLELTERLSNESGALVLAKQPG